MVGGLEASAERRPRWAFEPRISWLPAGAIPATAGAIAILALIAIALSISLRTTPLDGAWTLRHYHDLLSRPQALQVLLNTVGFSAVTVVVALVIGIPIAGLVAWTDLPFKPAVYVGMTVGLLMPGFFTAMGWLVLLHPRAGIINVWLVQAFNLKSGLFDIISIPGMGFVQGLGLASVVFVMLAAPLRALDPVLEEAAQTAGAGPWRTLLRITLPLVTPALAASAILVLVISLAVFDVPAIIGLAGRIFTFSPFIYYQVYPFTGPPDYGFAAAFSAGMLALAVLLSILYTRVLSQARRYEVIGPRSTFRQPRPLGVWRLPAVAFIAAYFALALLLPFLTLVWTALLPFLQPPSALAFGHLSLDNFSSLPWALIQETAINTAILMISVPTLALLLSISFSWVVLRSQLRGRLGYDYVAFLPQAVPSIVFALSALFFFLFVLPPSLGLYGTVVPIIVVMALVYVSFGTRVTNGAMIQIHRELEDAAAVSGGGRLVLMLRIVLPLMRPALAYSWLWMALLAFRELTVTNMLASRSTGTTLAVVTYSLFAAGNWGEAACLALIMVAVLLPLVAIYLKLAGLGGAVSGAVAAVPGR